jgi:hypothetical protein
MLDGQMCLKIKSFMARKTRADAMLQCFKNSPENKSCMYEKVKKYFLSVSQGNGPRSLSASTYA